MNLSEVKVASAAHLSQKNVKDFRNTSITLAQFEHFRFRSDVARATSRNTVQSRKFLTFTINIHQPGGYVWIFRPSLLALLDPAPASGPRTLPQNPPASGLFSTPQQELQGAETPRWETSESRYQKKMTGSH